jgi:dTMP kinase
MNRQGLLISLEGPDGAGKTTQAANLAALARKAGPEIISTREPGGTLLGDAVRSVLLDPAFTEMAPLTEVFLYAAARAQLFEQVIQPALQQGSLVICDRFIDSSLAYQAYGGGVDFDFVLNVNLAAVRGRWPDRTFILDVPPEEGLKRLSGRSDRVEQKPLSFHRRVRDGFLALAQRYPERITVVNAALPSEQVRLLIREAIMPFLSGYGDFYLTD